MNKGLENFTEEWFYKKGWLTTAANNYTTGHG